MREPGAISLEAIEQASDRIRPFAIRTPLLPLQGVGPHEIYLKLENLQPIGSFKVRGAANALADVPRELLKQGVWTASAGNMAQGVGWVAKQLQVPFSAVIPDHAPWAKRGAIERLSGTIHSVPFEEWWQLLMQGAANPRPGHFVHPVCDADVIAGNGTIGLEILEDLPDVDRVLVPFGGGGLISGIASALRGKESSAHVVACEVETAAPLRAALESGEPTWVNYTASFVDGIGGRSILPAMEPLVRSHVAQSLVVSLRQVADSIRHLALQQGVIAEGAGAASVAAAGANPIPGKTVCVVSGGNLESSILREILLGRTPGIG